MFAPAFFAPRFFPERYFPPIQQLVEEVIELVKTGGGIEMHPHYEVFKHDQDFLDFINVVIASGALD